MIGLYQPAELALIYTAKGKLNSQEWVKILI
jgi:hypothetical protein